MHAQRRGTQPHTLQSSQSPNTEGELDEILVYRTQHERRMVKEVPVDPSPTGLEHRGDADSPISAFLPYALKEVRTTEEELVKAETLNWRGCFRGRGMRMAEPPMIGVDVDAQGRATFKHGQATFKLCHQTNKGVLALLELLPKATKLAKLDLANNYFGGYGPEDIDSLASKLGQLRNLRELNLAKNALTDFGRGEEAVMKLWASLASTNITHLNLAGNNLTNFGNSFACVLALFKALPSTKITNIDLSATNLTKKSLQPEDGIDALAAALQSSRLTHLNLGDNCINADSASTLLGAFGARPTLQVVDLSNNDNSLKDPKFQVQYAEKLPSIRFIWNSPREVEYHCRSPPPLD